MFQVNNNEIFLIPTLTNFRNKCFQFSVIAMDELDFMYQIFLIKFYNIRYLTSVTRGTRHWKSTSSFPNWSFPVCTMSFEPSTTFSSMRRSSLALVLSEIEKTISSPSTSTVFHRFPQFDIFEKQQKITPDPNLISEPNHLPITFLSHFLLEKSLLSLKMRKEFDFTKIRVWNVWRILKGSW